MVGTSTEAARLHAIERWHLPHYMKDLEIAFTQTDGQMEVNVRDEGAPVLDLVVTDHDFEPITNLYHAFTVDGDDRFKANIFMEAPHSEHEEEGGSLTLHEHPDDCAPDHRRGPHVALPGTVVPGRAADVRAAGEDLSEARRVFVIFNPASGRGRGARRIATYHRLLEDRHAPA